MSMSAKGNGTGGKGGAALVTAIVFVFFLTLFGLAFYRLGETDIDLFVQEKNQSKAFYASEAGLDKVRWMLRESHKIAEANPSKDPNPFSNTYVEANAISIANPTGGDFFPDEAGKPYFRVSMIQDVSDLDPAATKSKVRVRVLGSVDADDDGLGGLTDYRWFYLRSRRCQPKIRGVCQPSRILEGERLGRGKGLFRGRWSLLGEQALCNSRRGLHEWVSLLRVTTISLGNMGPMGVHLFEPGHNG